MFVKISEHDEQKLRSLAMGMAQGIRDPKEIMKELGVTEEDWKELEKSRTFRKIMGEAQHEWNSAGSTSKRIKLKAGINIEQSLSDFYVAMNDTNQPLGARVRLLEAMTVLAGLPEVEATERAPGAQFKLEIHLGNDRVDVVQMGGAIPERPLPQDPTREQVHEVVKQIIQGHESFKLPDYILTPEE